MKLILPICMLLVMGISGCTADCTIPGTSISLPFCGTGLNAADDVLVIKEIRAVPETITVPQSLRLIAAIENRGDRAFSDVTGPITVELFDYCVGLFSTPSQGLGETDSLKINCPAGDERVGNTCKIRSLLPGEIKEVMWVLDPSTDTKLVTKCTLKVSATYPYITDGLTTVHFINSQEYLRETAEGTFKTRSSTISRGLGPVKAWFEIKDQQPIVAAPIINAIGSSPEPGFVPASLIIENRGSGIVKSQDGAGNIRPEDKGQPVVRLEDTNINAFGAVLSTDGSASSTGCTVLEPTSFIRLVQNKRTLPCSIKQKTDVDVSKETTEQLNVQISYYYEVRAEKVVTVEPAFNPTK